MDKKLDAFVKERGHAAGLLAVESYRSRVDNFDDAWIRPMAYASGFTSARLAKAISTQWMNPLKRQARISGISAIVALVCLITTMFYAWSLVSFTSFAQFLVVFAPTVVAMLFTIAKSYKTWAEAKKHLAEANAIAAAGPSDATKR